MSESKVALVTGASRGIGAAIAARLARDHHVVGSATSEAGARAIAAELGASGQGIVLRVDDDASVTAAFEQLAGSCGMLLLWMCMMTENYRFI